ncbi:MAG: hypothetical protein U5K79_12705 [Cyclobacteriaceae bacterium]|nr:hypothetical protein [Cyclobacteriaceae bacterium]
MRKRKTTLPTEAIAVATIDIDSTRVFTTEPEELFYLPSPRLVRYFGEKGGNIRCKLNCSNSLGLVKIHLIWEFPVIDAERYFGGFNEGSKVTFTLEDGQMVEVVMGDESADKTI